MNESGTRQFYAQLAEEARALLRGEHDLVANAANLAALLYWRMEAVNWVGFYLLRDGELVVGPFQGKPACVRIALGQGVCGTAAATGVTQRVADVHAFEGHIACDPDSNAEIVIPLVHGGSLLGVLDIDSPRAGRFDAADQEGLETLARVFLASLDGPSGG
jgi:GAF domain-containing protein